MAGAGYKLYLTGDVLSAADVNNYLQEQTVMIFATSAARTSALSLVLAEGMMSYLQDSNSVQVYNGTAWVAVGGSSPLTTKGDLYGFSTLDARVPIGTNNQVLTADSAQALGLKWSTPAGAMTLLSTTALSGLSTVTISSIDQTYKDLYVLIRGVYQNSGSGGATNLRLNGDTAGNYNSQKMRVNGSTIAGSTSNNATSYEVTAVGPTTTYSNRANIDFVIPRYAETEYKFFTTFGKSGNADDFFFDILGCNWNNTAAITSITYSISSSTFGSPGNIYIYGVK